MRGQCLVCKVEDSRGVGARSRGWDAWCEGLRGNLQAWV